jgi:hypothetical protein
MLLNALSNETCEGNLEDKKCNGKKSNSYGQQRQFAFQPRGAGVGRWRWTPETMTLWSSTASRATSLAVAWESGVWSLESGVWTLSLLWCRVARLLRQRVACSAGTDRQPLAIDGEDMHLRIRDKKVATYFVLPISQPKPQPGHA